MRPIVLIAASRGWVYVNGATVTNDYSYDYYYLLVVFQPRKNVQAVLCFFLRGKNFCVCLYCISTNPLLSLKFRVVCWVGSATGGPSRRGGSRGLPTL